MTLLERLQAHKGGLIQIKTQLFWYGGRGWDGSPGRICLVLGTAPGAGYAGDAAPAAAEAAATAASDGAALLLIDGRLRWIWVAEADVELIDEAR